MISEIKSYEGLYLIDTEVLSMMREIKGYEGLYSIDTDGNVYRHTSMYDDEFRLLTNPEVRVVGAMIV